MSVMHGSLRTGTTLAAAVMMALVSATGTGTSAAPNAAPTEGDLTLAYHRRYPLEPGGRVSLSNFAGTVRIATWDHPVVEVHAIKSACTSQRLKEARVEIEAEPADIRIRTLYSTSDPIWTDDQRARCDSSASVDYILLVPRDARLNDITQVHGDLQIEGPAGSLTASTVSGRLTARGLSGEATLSTIHGRLEVSVDDLVDRTPLTLSSVDGSIQLFLPQESDARLTAHTMTGAILNDFGLPVRRRGVTGVVLDAVLGVGGSSVAVTNVTGSIAIRMSREI